jgi:hypothetical protein
VVGCWSLCGVCLLDLLRAFCKLSEQSESASETKWPWHTIQAAADRPQSEETDNLLSKDTDTF